MSENRIKQRLGYLAALPLFAFAAGAVAAPQPPAVLDPGPWPMYCHDAQHTCRSNYKGLTAPPAAPEWVFIPPGRHGISAPTAISAAGAIYTGSWKDDNFVSDKTAGHSGVLSALSPAGRALWAHNSGRGSAMASAIESAPLLTADGKIIYGKDDGCVYALDIKGKLLWQSAGDDPFDPGNPYDDNEQFIPSPALGPDGTVYICSHWGNVYNPLVMRQLARVQPKIKELGIKPVKAPHWGRLYALDSRTGSRKWVFDPSAEAGRKQGIWGSPAVTMDGTVIFGAYDEKGAGCLYAVRPYGALRWSYPARGGKGKLLGLYSPPSIGADGTIYISGSAFGRAAARVYAFTPEGALKWEYPLDENRVTGAAAVAPDGTLYVGAHNWGFIMFRLMPKKGHLYALADKGAKAALKWKFAVDYGIVAPPAADSEGNAFFGTHGDPFIIGKAGPYRVYAVSKAGKELWSYPLEGQVYSPPVIGKGGAVYVGTTLAGSGRLYKFARP